MRVVETEAHLARIHLAGHHVHAERELTSCDIVCIVGSEAHLPTGHILGYHVQPEGHLATRNMPRIVGPKTDLTTAHGIQRHVDTACDLRPAHLPADVHSARDLGLLHILGCHIYSTRDLGTVHILCRHVTPSGDLHTGQPALHHVGATGDLHSRQRVPHGIAESCDLDPFQRAHGVIDGACDLYAFRVPTNEVREACDLQTLHVMAFDVRHAPQFESLQPTRITCEHVEGEVVDGHGCDVLVAAHVGDEGDLPLPVLDDIEVRGQVELVVRDQQTGHSKVFHTTAIIEADRIDGFQHGAFPQRKTGHHPIASDVDHRVMVLSPHHEQGCAVALATDIECEGAQGIGGGRALSINLMHRGLRHWTTGLRIIDGSGDDELPAYPTLVEEDDVVAGLLQLEA